MATKLIGSAEERRKIMQENNIQPAGLTLSEGTDYSMTVEDDAEIVEVKSRTGKANKKIVASCSVKGANGENYGKINLPVKAIAESITKGEKYLFDVSPFTFTGDDGKDITVRVTQNFRLQS